MTMSTTDYPNWFAQIAQHNFEKFLLPEAGKPNLRYLQLGVFTGDATVWLLDNVLTSDTAWLTDVDTWEGAPNEPIQEQMNFYEIRKIYQSRIAARPVTAWGSTTFNYLFNIARDREDKFDFIYVDAHHTSASAFLDCELSWPLLKSGGILAIDDYEWQHPDGLEIHAPKLGIHMFLDRHDGEYETLVVNQQYWIKKK